MAKRYRQFKRINLTAIVAQFLRDSLVDRTFTDHYKKCADQTDCHHHTSGNLAVARLVEAGIKVGKKRGSLDVPCPYKLDEPDAYIKTLEQLVERIKAFAENVKVPRTKAAILRAGVEIDDYAHRNAMEVLAEAVIDVDFSPQ